MGQPASSRSVYNSTLSGNVASAAGGALAANGGPTKTQGLLYDTGGV